MRGGGVLGIRLYFNNHTSQKETIFFSFDKPAATQFGDNELRGPDLRHGIVTEWGLKSLYYCLPIRIKSIRMHCILPAIYRAFRAYSSLPNCIVEINKAEANNWSAFLGAKQFPIPFNRKRVNFSHPRYT